MSENPNEANAGKPASMAKARLIRRSLAALAIAAVLLTAGLMGPRSGWFVMPGPLSNHHAVLGKNCTACHAAGEQLTKGFLHGLREEEIGKVESTRCLKCHLFGENGRLPHALPSAETQALTAGAAAEGGGGGAPLALQLSAWIGSPPHDAAGGTFCATCHREHQGHDADLTQLTNNQCQSCHLQQFADFSRGHPELGEYPYKQRTAIVFDHGTHEGKHYPQKGLSFDCAGCHKPDDAGTRMKTAGFDAACAQCHTAEMAGEGRTGIGIEFLRLPGLDLEVLMKLGHPVGGWPADAAYGYDALPTAFMGLLLAGDPKYPEYAEDKELIAPLDLTDLVQASDEELAAVARYTWAVKRLIYDLSGAGQGALALRIERALGGNADPAESARLASFLSRDAVQDAADRWLRSLMREMPQHDGTALPSAQALGSGQSKWPTAGAWLRDDKSYALLYLSTGHADPFLREWLDETGRLFGASPEAAAVFSFLRSEDGRCTKCHSVDATESGGRLVHWEGAEPPVGRQFTEFSHKPHLRMPLGKGCRECHALNPDAKYLESYATDQLDPFSFESDHRPMLRQDCATCHNRREAGDSCTLCHAYHIGDFPLPMPASGAGPFGAAEAGEPR